MMLPRTPFVPASQFPRGPAKPLSATPTSFAGYFAARQGMRGMSPTVADILAAIRRMMSAP
jgi:hypothetical protein